MQHIAISGELGSGKSAVSQALAEALGVDTLSTGAIHREIAASRGMSALEANLAAEDDDEIDARIDGELVRRAQASDGMILDSRLAWHFVPDALKVHLVVDPTVGASRMLGRSATDVEAYASVEEAAARAEDRHASEQRRFLDTYAVDIDRLRNYDVVVDTSHAPVEEIAAWILALHTGGGGDTGPVLCVSPQRLLPSAAAPGDADALAQIGRALDDDPRGTGHRPRLGYRRPWFVVVEGHEVVSAALRGGRTLLRAGLAAEGDEVVTDAVTAGEWLATHVEEGALDAWEGAHGFRFAARPTATGTPGSG